MKGIREKVIHVEPGCQCLSQARRGSVPCLQECEYPSAPPGWRLLPPVSPGSKGPACSLCSGKGTKQDVHSY